MVEVSVAPRLGANAGLAGLVGQALAVIGLLLDGVERLHPLARPPCRKAAAWRGHPNNLGLPEVVENED